MSSRSPGDASARVTRDDTSDDGAEYFCDPVRRAAVCLPVTHRDGGDQIPCCSPDGEPSVRRKALAERMLNAEMDVHLADEGEKAAGNHRNGTSQKTVDTGSERIVLDIPRDRQGCFDPVAIGKYQRRFPGFDEKIIAMYSRGVSTRDIQAYVGELREVVQGERIDDEMRRLIEHGGDRRMLVGDLVEQRVDRLALRIESIAPLGAQPLLDARDVRLYALL